MTLRGVKLIFSIFYPEMQQQDVSSTRFLSIVFTSSLQSGEKYFCLWLSSSTNVCNVFHLLLGVILFHVLALKMYYPVDVSVCFLAALAGFKRLFFLFFPPLSA